jgi:predicted outer membrane protein
MGGQSMDSTALMTSLSSNTGLTSDQRAGFDRLFLTKAAMGNMAEIMTSQLAMQKSKNAQVRQIAQQMVTEHSRAQSELIPIMQRRGVPVPTTVGAMHTATFQQLQRARGNNFDQLYMAAQAEAHEETVSLYQAALPMVNDPDARAYITRNLPPVVGHTQMVYTVARTVNAPGIELRPAIFPLASLSGMGGMTLTNSMAGGMTGGTNGGTTMGMGSTGSTRGNGATSNSGGNTGGTGSSANGTGGGAGTTGTTGGGTGSTGGTTGGNGGGGTTGGDTGGAGGGGTGGTGGGATGGTGAGAGGAGG